MHQPGVDIRPLKEMTGRALFNEVFLTDARVSDDALIGDRNNGWAVANATLMFERAGLSSGSGHAATSAALPGTVAGDLGKRAGDFVRNKRSRGGGAQFRGASRMLMDLATSTGKITDHGIRQDLMKSAHDLGDRPVQQSPSEGGAGPRRRHRRVSATSASSR